MKMYSFSSFRLLAIAASSFILWSCTKEKVSTPVSQQSAITSNADDALQPEENIVETVVPGTYIITNDIDDAVDHTADYADYTFQFNADGTLIATKDGVQYSGKWKTNDAETKMALVIKGTPELLKISGTSDKVWTISRLTDHSIILKRKGPDKVVFKLQ